MLLPSHTKRIDRRLPGQSTNTKVDPGGVYEKRHKTLGSCGSGSGSIWLVFFHLNAPLACYAPNRGGTG